MAEGQPSVCEHWLSDRMLKHRQGGVGTEKLSLFHFPKWVGTANAIGWRVEFTLSKEQ